MKKCLFCFVLSLLAVRSIGQTVLQPEKTEPKVAYVNIHVQKIAGDSLSSTFIIWIKKNVKSHFHQAHSEVVMVMGGKGTMQLGKETVNLEKGVLVFIPKGAIHSVTTTSRKPLKVLSIQSPHFDGSDRVVIGDGGY